MPIADFLAPIQGDSSPSQMNPFYDLYRYYIDLIVRFNVYYFAILGALLTYATTKDAISRIYPFLFIPFALSVLQVVYYVKFRELSKVIYERKASFLLAAVGELEKANGRSEHSILKSNPLLSILTSFAIVHVILIIFLAFTIIISFCQFIGVIGSGT